MKITNLAEARAHKALLWRNIRAARRLCAEHAELLQRTFAPVLNLKLPRIPKHQ